MNAISICWVLLNTVLLIKCYPTDTKKSRDRRQTYFYGSPGGMAGDDSALMRELWDQPVGLGFFVNPKGEADAAETESTARTLRDKIEGSGSPEFRRDEILSKPKEPVMDSQENTLSGEVKSKVESAKNKEKKDTDVAEQSDPGNKKKVRSSVTCQGQKEWIQCDGPYELIKINGAFWGRDDDKTCSKSDIIHGLKTNQNCTQDSENTLRKVREACDSENVCEVVASNIYFDQTDCPDVYKFLRLKWQCAPSESRIKENVS